MQQLLCTFGVHKRGKLQRVQIWHHGEFPWESWTHLCHGYARPNCQHCGLPSRFVWRKCSEPLYVGPRQTKFGYDWRRVPLGNRKLFKQHRP